MSIEKTYTIWANRYDTNKNRTEELEIYIPHISEYIEQAKSYGKELLEL